MPDDGRRDRPPAAGRHSGEERFLAKFVGLTSVIAVERDWEALHSCFDDFPDDVAVALGSAVGSFLAERARETGDWKTWALALHHLPHPGRRAARDELGKRLDAAAREVDDRTKKVISISFRLLEYGVSAQSLVDDVRRFNATLPNPLPQRTVDQLLIWTAKRHLRNATRSSNV